MPQNDRIAVIVPIVTNRMRLPPIVTARRHSRLCQRSHVASAIKRMSTSREPCATTSQGFGTPRATETASPKKGTFSNEVISRKLMLGEEKRLATITIVRNPIAATPSQARPACKWNRTKQTSAIKPVQMGI